MTPEERAKELIDRFRKELSWIENDYRVDLWRDAQQCAIICVNEILELRLFGKTKAYWQSVLNSLTKVKQ